MTFEWTVFFGDAADAEARVYVLATPIGDSADAASLEGLKITGRVEGPKCRYSHTLPARIPVRHRGVRTSDGDVALARPELVGEAIVPDPNFWTPELPFLYRATVEVRRGEEVVAKYEQDFGIRPLGVRGKRLVFDGKIWVPRAVQRKIVVGDAPLELWRETATVMVVDDPDDELCREASEVGVILFARVTKFDDVLERVRAWNRYPSVVLIIVDQHDLSHSVLSLPTSSSRYRNILLADRDELREGARGESGPVKARVIQRSRDRMDLVVEEMNESDRPALIQGNTGKRLLSEARSVCDELQAEFAGKCDPAGYIV
jgi:hypothetical protein